MRLASGIALMATMAVAVACASPSASDPGSAESSILPSEPAAERCAPIDLRTPSGQQINLNGTWETQKEGTRGGIYYFRQVGTCFWFVGGFPGDDPEAVDIAGPLSYVTVTFHGRLSPDFTITGEWVDAREQFVDQPGPGGTMDLRIVVDEAGVTHVEYVGGTGQPFVEPGYREEQSWVKIADGGAYPPPP